MARKQATNPTDNLTRYQRFEIVTVNRQAIKKAPYNPRVLDDTARKLLRKNIETNGLVEPLVWNKRTGNLVGGHQRISQIDDLEGRDDYALTVSQVDVDERQEQILNIALNNTNLQGQWDEERVGEIIEQFTMQDFDAAGFTPADIDYYVMSDEALREDNPDTRERAEAKATLDAIKQDRSEMQQRQKQENSGDFHLTVLFRDDQEKAEWLERFGFHRAETYIRGSDLLERLKVVA